MRAIFATAALLAVTPVWGQGTAIRHDEVGCIVAEKFPKMGACFTPPSQVARARVYFRAHESVGWYFVEMKSDAPCFSGILPKPKKAMIGKQIDYYLEVLGKDFAENRTEEYAPEVVGSASECKKKLLATPLGRASVVVGATSGAPAVPVGFAAAGGLSTTAVVVGVVGAGAAVGGVAAATGGSDQNVDTVTTLPAPTSTTPQVTSPPATTLPPVSTTLQANNGPPTLVLAVAPRRGPAPLEVRLNSCRSTDPDRDELRYSFEFGDGTRSNGDCQVDHVYHRRGASGPGVGALADDVFVATGCVTDRFPGHESCESVRIEVIDTTPVCDTTGPSVSITHPRAGAVLTALREDITVDVSDADGIAQVAYYAAGGCCVLPRAPETPRRLIGVATEPPFGIRWQLPPDCGVPYEIEAEATDNCGNVSVSRPIPVTITSQFCSGTGTPSGLELRSDLAVPGASAQLVLNGIDAVFSPSGRTNLTLHGRAGENRLEAQLVAADGRAGSWRIELPGITPASIHVIAGDVAMIAGDVVVFRLRGEPGERVVFSFSRP